MGRRVVSVGLGEDWGGGVCEVGEWEARGVGGGSGRVWGGRGGGFFEEIICHFGEEAGVVGIFVVFVECRGRCDLFQDVGLLGVLVHVFVEAKGEVLGF